MCSRSAIDAALQRHDAELRTQFLHDVQQHSDSKIVDWITKQFNNRPNTLYDMLNRTPSGKKFLSWLTNTSKGFEKRLQGDAEWTLVWPFRAADMLRIRTTVKDPRALLFSGKHDLPVLPSDAALARNQNGGVQTITLRNALNEQRTLTVTDAVGASRRITIPDIEVDFVIPTDKPGYDKGSVGTNYRVIAVELV